MKTCHRLRKFAEVIEPERKNLVPKYRHLSYSRIYVSVLKNSIIVLVDKSYVVVVIVCENALRMAKSIWNKNLCKSVYKCIVYVRYYIFYEDCAF